MSEEPTRNLEFRLFAFVMCGQRQIQFPYMTPELPVLWGHPILLPQVLLAETHWLGVKSLIINKTGTKQGGI